jgi:predicted glycoside hydrolase/deacetylase ChbG (UPF0249 family)
VPRLWVIADDFGLHADLNAAMARCASAGRLSGVSVAPNGSGADWALLRKLQRDGVRVGLHLCLVGEPWLSRKKQFSKWSALAPMLMRPSFKSQIEREALQQIEVLLAHEIRIDHIDSHQHVHVMEPIFSIVMRLAKDFGVGRVRVPVAASGVSRKGGLAGAVLEHLSARRVDRVRGAGLVSHACVGIRKAGLMTPGVLAEELEAAARVGAGDVEYVSHPGHPTGALQSRYGHWRFDWSAELETLLGREFTETLKRTGYEVA